MHDALMLLPDPLCGSSLLVSPVFLGLPRLRHGFSTRSLGDASGGVPGGQAVTRALGASAARWSRHAVSQVHGADAVTVNEGTPGDAGAGDALVTAARGRLLVVRTADCLPILVAALGPGGVRGVAAVHAGWRGLVAGILDAAVTALGALAPASRVVAALGPCIGPCCFEVGPEVAAPLRALGGATVLRPGERDRSFADLAAVARARLHELGVAVPDAHAPPCTRCHAEIFPSWRRDGAEATRMAAFIGIETP